MFQTKFESLGISDVGIRLIPVILIKSYILEGELW
jgi:hypothetical protein